MGHGKNKPMYFPTNIVHGIYKHLDHRSIALSGCVCKEWLHVSTDKQLWTERFLKDFGGWPEKTYSRCQYLSEHSLRHGECRIGSIDCGRFLFVCLTNQLAIGRSSDTGIVIMSTEGGGEFMGSVAETQAQHIACRRQVLVGGTAQGVVRCWDLQAGTVVTKRHNNGYCYVDVGSDVFISSGIDKSIRVYRIKDGECILTLTGHTSYVTCSQINDRDIVSGSDDGSVRVWDRASGECVRKVQLEDDVASLECNERHVAVGLKNGKVILLDMDTLGVVREINGHTSTVFDVLLSDSNMISGSFDGTIKVWDLQRGQCVRQFDRVYGSSIHYDGKRLFCGCYGYIKVWDFA